MSRCRALHRNLPKVLLLFILFSSAISAGAEGAKSREDIALELKSVKTKLEIENGRFKSLRDEESKLKQSLTNLTADAKRLDAEEENLRIELKRLDGEIDSTEKEVQTTAKQIDRQRGTLRDRTVAIYKLYRRSSPIGYVTEASSFSNMLVRARYLSAVTESDRGKVDRLVSAVETLQGQQQQLVGTRNTRANALERVVRLERELDSKREQMASLVQETEQKKKQQEKMLETLKRSAADLEKILASIMGSEEPREKGVEKTPATVTAGTTEKREEPIISDPFVGEGLAKLQGRMQVPIQGKVIQRFGKQRHEEFSDIVFVKGLEFTSAIGARVTPVAKGKVIVSQNLAGLGNVVIVDHGARYYSLYGRLASTLVQVGDVVSPVKSIGITGEPDFRGRNFYFELRLKGQAIDPMSYFARKPEVSA